MVQPLIHTDVGLYFNTGQVAVHVLVVGHHSQLVCNCTAQQCKGNFVLFL